MTTPEHWTDEVRPDWAEGTWPTAEEWIVWFKANTLEKQKQIAQDLLNMVQTGADCVLARHEARARQQTEDIVALEQARTLMRGVNSAMEEEIQRLRQIEKSYNELRLGVQAMVPIAMRVWDSTVRGFVSVAMEGFKSNAVAEDTPECTRCWHPDHGTGPCRVQEDGMDKACSCKWSQ